MNASFTLLDWGLLLIFLVSLILGIMKGLVRELFSLGFLIIGAALAYRLSPPLGSLLQGWIKEQALARFFAFVLVLVLVILVGIWVTWVVKKVFVHGALSFLDRFFGGVLGAVRGVLIGCVLLLAMVQLPEGRRMVNSSILAGWCMSGMHAAVRLLPRELEKKMEGYLNHAEQKNRGNRGTI